MALVKTVRHIFEPNPLACGQAVVSMLSGVDVSEVIKFCGTDREIDLKTLKRALKNYGINCSDNRIEVKTISHLPTVALLSLETPRCWHWSLYYNGTVYDPEHGMLSDFPQSNRKYYWEIKDEQI